MNENSKIVQTYDVKVGGVVVPMSMEQLIANAGRGVLASRDKNYNAPHKKNAERLEALALSDEEYQALLDAKNGNKEAGEFFYKSLTTDNDDETGYKPTIKKEKSEVFDFLSSAKEYSPASYGKFMETISGIGHDIYSKILSNQDSYTRESEAKKLYDDIISGDFNSKIGLAMFESSQSDKDILSAYSGIEVKTDNAQQQSDNNNQGNENTPSSLESNPQFYTPNVERQQEEQPVIQPEGNTQQDMVNDWKEKMKVKYG